MLTSFLSFDQHGRVNHSKAMSLCRKIPGIGSGCLCWILLLHICLCVREEFCCIWDRLGGPRWVLRRLRHGWLVLLRLVHLVWGRLRTIAADRRCCRRVLRLSGKLSTCICSSLSFLPCRMLSPRSLNCSGRIVYHPVGECKDTSSYCVVKNLTHFRIFWHWRFLLAGGSRLINWSHWRSPQDSQLTQLFVLPDLKLEIYALIFEISKWLIMIRTAAVVHGNFHLLILNWLRV